MGRPRQFWDVPEQPWDVPQHSLDIPGQSQNNPATSHDCIGTSQDCPGRPQDSPMSVPGLLQGIIRYPWGSLSLVWRVSRRGVPRHVSWYCMRSTRCLISPMADAVIRQAVLNTKPIRVDQDGSWLQERRAHCPSPFEIPGDKTTWHLLHLSLLARVGHLADGHIAEVG